MSQMPPPNLVALMKQNFAPQRPFSYPRESWRSWVKGIPEAVKTIDSLPEALDRQIVTEVFESLWPDNVPGAFVAAMIWGHGSSKLWALPYSESPHPISSSQERADRLLGH